jgi:AcrR family transcriptional regulator
MGEQQSRALLSLLIDALQSGRLAVMTAQASASQTARQRARAELTREIKHEARRQLASHGAEGLSLRAVARELGMVSSALYRYFPSRDDLLTALIIDAYDALGEAAEAASAAVAAADAAGGRGRWRALCAAIRGWALAHPHEYALIYGSPVPGYQAPQATIASAVRVVRALGGVLAGVEPGAGAGAGAALGAGAAVGDLPPGGAPPLPDVLAAQTGIVADAIAPGTPGPVIARGLIAWTQLFGLISFELFGQLVGTLDPADEFFGYAVEQMAGFIGLP